MYSIQVLVVQTTVRQKGTLAITLLLFILQKLPCPATPPSPLPPAPTLPPYTHTHTTQHPPRTHETPQGLPFFKHGFLRCPQKTTWFARDGIKTTRVSGS